MATILCLDDEPAIGLILQDTLERAGHETVSAHNVPQALQALQAGTTVDLMTASLPQPLQANQIAALGGFLFGYDTAIINGAGTAIQHVYHLGPTAKGFVDNIAEPSVIRFVL